MGLAFFASQNFLSEWKLDYRWIHPKGFETSLSIYNEIATRMACPTLGNSALIRVIKETERRGHASPETFLAVIAASENCSSQSHWCTKVYTIQREHGGQYKTINQRLQ